MMVHGMLAAGGTGIQGVAPKYLLTEADDGKWYPDAALPDARARRHPHHAAVRLRADVPGP